MTLELVAFSGEEYMEKDVPMGSDAYVRRHKGEDIHWLLNIDGGDLFSKRFIRIGFHEKLPQLEHGIEDVIYTCEGGDNGPFCKAGIPAVWPFCRPYLGVLQTAFDSIEHIDYDLLTRHAKETLDLLQQLIRTTS